MSNVIATTVSGASGGISSDLLRIRNRIDSSRSKSGAQSEEGKAKGKKKKRRENKKNQAIRTQFKLNQDEQNYLQSSAAMQATYLGRQFRSRQRQTGYDHHARQQLGPKIPW